MDRAVVENRDQRPGAFGGAVGSAELVEQVNKVGGALAGADMHEKSPRYRVESAEHLTQLLKHCLDTPGVHLIDCPVDYSENDQILNKDIKDLSKKV